MTERDVPSPAEHVFRLSRPPEWVGGHPERVPPLLILALMALSAGEPLGRDAPILTAVLSALVFLCVFGIGRELIARARAEQIISARLHVMTDRLAITDQNDAPILAIDYHDLHSIEPHGVLGRRGLVLSRASTAQIGLPDARFEQHEEAGLFEALLWERIEARPGGLDRVAQLRERVLVGRRARGIPWITLALAAVVTALFVLQVRTDTTALPRLALLGVEPGAALLAGDLGTSLRDALLHTRWSHLAMNVSMLVVLAIPIERLLGRARFAVLIGPAALAGSLVSALFFPDRVSIGASCGATALVGALVYLNLARRDELSYVQRQPLLAVLFYPVFLFLSGLGPGTNLIAHMGGLVAGFLLCGALVHRKRLAGLADETPRWLAGLGLAIAGAYGAAAIAIAVRAFALL